MPIIDEEGRLFGTVNVVDALVVLLVLAVGVAGVALVAGGASSDETRYATVDLGTQPEYVVEQLSTGDTSNLTNSPGNLTISDIHVSSNESNVNALVRVAVAGQVTEGTFTYGGEPLRLGRTLEFDTDAYAVNGSIQDVGNTATLPTQERSVIVTGTAPTGVAAGIDTGSEITVGGRSVGSVDAVATYDAEADDRRSVYTVVTLRTYGEENRFGGTPIQAGRDVTLPLAGAQFSGTVDRFSDTLSRGSQEVVVTSVVDAETARAMSSGDTFTVTDDTVATIESVSVYGTDDPDQRRVYVSLTLQTLEYGDVPRFGPQQVREDAAIPFETATYNFTGQITRIGTVSQPGELTTRTVELQLDNIRPERAGSIREGLTETNGGRTIAEVTDVTTEPATITLTSESGEIFERQHPVNKDVTLTVELQVRERDSRVQFKSETIQEGGTVLLDLDSTTIQPTVVDLDGG
ncbi:hypothetical protein C475_15568 [Halosimplex carlsbadense 2-9-1]|uniref:DUF4330 domain-containing protein n=1 Tax=Halosimplex carlsbadense 2-9-1 TaxID=797114 RepID=M0CM46_9EURY|nr:DUF4330 family protein [Halosimplex carlsbadense]ELZ23703.1 hypothetical protein C475_15568 [Halosimplex carlsbadense 2-9-1]